MVDRLTTKQLLAESLLELVDRHKFTDITAQMIADNCSVSRRTFYNNFTDKYELLEYANVYLFRKAFEEIKASGTYYDFELFCVNAVKRSTAYDMLMQTMPQREPFSAIVFNVMHALLVEQVSGTFPDGKADERTLFALDYYIRGAADTIYAWYTGGQEIPAEKLARLILENVPGHLAGRLAFDGRFLPKEPKEGR